MGTIEIKLPENVQPKRLASGVIAYYWVLPRWARSAKDKGKSSNIAISGKPCPFESSPLGSDLSKAIRKAEALNEAIAQWRAGDTSGPVRGSVRWLFAWYREHERFKSLDHQSRAAYHEKMDSVCDVPLKVGTLGDRSAAKVDAVVADKAYAKLRVKGERHGSYAMQVCRRVWNEAVRSRSATGIDHNPFSKMKISTASTPTAPFTRAQYDAYRATARAMGLQSMATAAALAFELTQRPWDVFGIPDPDGRKVRGILWVGYRPGVSMTITQSKTEEVVTIPLADYQAASQEWRLLYPDLEEELARTPRIDGQDQIVLEERTGRPYSRRGMFKTHRKICDQAGLPKTLTPRSFRTGGSTEIGDAGIDDQRAVTGHRVLRTTAIYNRANEKKALAIGSHRRDYIDAERAADNLDNSDSRKIGK